ncbi:MAG: type IV pilus secretin PilQ [Chromatiaceae bacterium]|nr:type IV pilus secretin PilQ [Gammaproteobacteria bacterium]MCP5304848.1 type IV pilus secretin PilQ [Chromatiaceae bacterium]MCP5314807.1 type IV pilus secretin PilQ [Chromatiaceae bacterium]
MYKKVKALNTALIGVLLWAFLGEAIANELQDVSFSALPGNRVEIVLTTSEPVAEPASFTTDNPARIAIDLVDTTNALEQKVTPVAIGMARSVTAIAAGDRTRVVINLLEQASHTVRAEGNKVYVSIGASSGAGTMSPTSAPSAVMTDKRNTSSRAGLALENVDFRRGTQGEGRIEIELSDPSIVVDMRQQGDQVILDFLNADLPEQLARTLDVLDFATPVKAIETRPDGRNVRMTISTSGEFEHLAYQANNTYTVEFRGLTKQEKEARRKEQQIYEGDRLSLNFQDIEVRAVLQLLADFTGLNMVVSDTVSGRITLRLKNVPWDQAMDIILKTKGLSMRRNDNVVLVAPTEEIAAREKLELESQQQIAELAPLRSELIQVNYAKAQDLAALLKSSENKLISERGSVSIDERTNTLLVQDTAAKLSEVRALVGELDIPIRQVLIESRIVIANNDFARDLGVKLGVGVAGDGDSWRWKVAGGLPGDVASPEVGSTSFEIPAGSGNQGLLVNLPQTLASGSGGAVNFLLGKIGSYLLRLELSAMQQEGKGEIISSPRVITSDQNKATIKQGVEIPYQEASSSGATSVSFKEAVLKLEVTPHITPDDRVIMDLKVNKDNPDFTRAVLGVPPVDTRELETSVLVDNGETVVLGGVFERTKAKNRASVPFFGDLPYVGWAFQQNQIQDENSELLIFVTPKILKDTLTLR